MTTHVSSEALRAALDVAAAAAQCRNVVDVQGHLLVRLAAACRADLAIYHQVALTGSVQEYGVFWPPEERMLAALQAYPPLMHLSPLVKHFVAVGEPGDISVSDLMSRRQWRSHPIYVDAFSAIGIDDHLALLLTLREGRAHGFTVARQGRDFGCHEHAVLTLAAPHLAACLRRALAEPQEYLAIQTFPVPRWTRVVGPALRAEHDGILLTTRQREILRLVAEGLGNKQIARRLDLAPRTVDKHLENVYRTLDSSGRLEALARWESLCRAELDPLGAPAS